MKIVGSFVWFPFFVLKKWSLKCYKWPFFAIFMLISANFRSFGLIWYTGSQRSRYLLSENGMVCGVSRSGSREIARWNIEKTAYWAKNCNFFHNFKRQYLLSHNSKPYQSYHFLKEDNEIFQPKRSKLNQTIWIFADIIIKNCPNGPFLAFQGPFL